MDITLINIEPNKHSLNPEIITHLEVSFIHTEELPLNLSLNLVVNNLQIGTSFSNFADYSSEFSLIFIRNSHSLVENSQKSESCKSIRFRCLIQLSKKAINYIEEQRIANNGNIWFHFDLRIPFIQTYSIKYKEKEEIGLKYKLFEKKISTKILQSDWVQNFCSDLGIGDFILLEFPKLDFPENVDLKMKEIMRSMKHKLEKSKKYFLIGDWEGVIKETRLIFEGFKDKSDFGDFLCKMGYSEPQAKEFKKINQKLFDYCSKPGHFLERDGETMQIPSNFYREDAQFLYLTSLSMLNIIIQKLKRDF